jgi:hypothetical protein
MNLRSYTVEMGKILSRKAASAWRLHASLYCWTLDIALNVVRQPEYVSH